MAVTRGEVLEATGGKGRLEAFSDGVFAIAITILVLEIGVTLPEGGSLLEGVVEEWPSYLAYVISFLTIGVIWIEHAAMTESIDRANGVLLRINLLLLMAVSFLPFPTKLMAEHLLEPDAERVAVVLYGLVLLSQTLLLTLSYRYCQRAGLFAEGGTDRVELRQRERLLPALVFYVVAIGAGILLPYAALGLYLAIAVYQGIPIRRIGRRPTGSVADAADG